MSTTGDLGKVLFMALSKMSASADDLVWLLPFVTTKPSFGLTYVFLMCVISSVAISLAFGGGTLLGKFIDADGYWNSERVLSLSGSALLMLFSMYLFYDDMYVEEDGFSSAENVVTRQVSALSPRALPVVEEDGFSSVQMMGALDTSITVVSNVSLASTTGAPAQEVIPHLAQEVIPLAAPNPITGIIYVETPYTLQRLVTICIVGSMDDLVIQSILLLSNKLEWYHVLIGNAVGSFVVLLICLLGSRLRLLTSCIEKIPLWGVIGLFSIYCLTFTFVEV